MSITHLKSAKWIQDSTRLRLTVPRMTRKRETKVVFSPSTTRIHPSNKQTLLDLLLLKSSKSSREDESGGNTMAETRWKVVVHYCDGSAVVIAWGWWRLEQETSITCLKDYKSTRSSKKCVKMMRGEGIYGDVETVMILTGWLEWVNGAWRI